MVSHGEAALNRQLQKSFRIVHQSVLSLEEQLRDAGQILTSLGNMCEQFDCCTALKFDETPLKSHPDVKHKLLIKLSTEIETKTETLKMMLCSQQKFCQRITKQREMVRELYSKYNSQLYIETVLARTATLPSLADMTEWLVDTDVLLNQQVSSKQFLLGELEYNNTESLRTLLKTWLDGDKQVLGEIQKNLDLVSFFMQEDL